jgi:hypothetical protein
MKHLIVTTLLLAQPLLLPAAASAHDGERYGLPTVFGDRNPANPWESVPPPQYRSLTAATKSYRPVDPLPWDELNRRVAPRSLNEPSGAPAAPHKHH